MRERDLMSVIKLLKMLGGLEKQWEVTCYHGDTREHREGDQELQEVITTPEGDQTIYPNSGHSCRRLQPFGGYHPAKAHILSSPSASIPSYYLVTTHPEFTSSYHHHLCQNPQFPEACSCLWKPVASTLLQPPPFSFPESVAFGRT